MTDLLERYEDDLFLVKGAAGWAAVVLLIVGLAALPIVLPMIGRGYLLFIAVLAAANVIVAIGLNLLVGYTGLISLGHAGFVAIGAYASGLLVSRLGIPWYEIVVFDRRLQEAARLEGLVASTPERALALHAQAGRLARPFTPTAPAGCGCS